MTTYINSLVLMFMASIFHTDGRLILTTIPEVIEADLSKSLTINCSFYEPGSGNLAVSLILKKEDGADNATLTELAHIDTHLNALATSSNHTNATCKGQLDASHGSYLSLQWAYPSLLESGKYVCEGYIMNSQGEVHYQSAQATVWSSAPQVAQIVERIQEIETNLKDAVNNIASLSNLQSSMLREINSLQAVKNDWKNVLFSSSPLYVDENGPRHYHLSRFQPQDATNAQAACAVLEGYLAEVDNQLEYGYIVNFIKASLEGGINILLGGILGPYGEWVTRRNGTLLGYTHWYPDYVNIHDNFTTSASEQCQSVSANYTQTIYMENITCFNTGNKSLYFLCEDEKY